jgi:RepB DNA-primase from phage plasmid
MNSDDRFTPRSLTTSQYVRELFGPADNVAILVRNRSTGHTVQTIARAETVVDADFQRWLSHQSATGYDVYIGMNPIKEGAHNRTKDSIEAVRHVYLDLDKNGDQVLQAIWNSPEVPAPNFVLDTSPGKHQVVWKVSTLNQDEAETLLHSLANRFDGDLAATDSTRVLRLPGFPNHKLAEEFIVQARQETNAVYALRDFTIDEDSPEAQRHIGDSRAPQRKLPSSHRSQSERDWAYAKRALARGDDPEVVIQRIADYRAEDKSDPKYYARRTVAKARVGLHPAPSALKNDSYEDERPQPSQDRSDVP